MMPYAAFIDIQQIYVYGAGASCYLVKVNSSKKSSNLCHIFNRNNIKDLQGYGVACPYYPPLEKWGGSRDDLRHNLHSLVYRRYLDMVQADPIPQGGGAWTTCAISRILTYAVRLGVWCRSVMLLFSRPPFSVCGSSLSRGVLSV